MPGIAVHLREGRKEEEKEIGGKPAKRTLGKEVGKDRSEARREQSKEEEREEWKASSSGEEKGTKEHATIVGRSDISDGNAGRL